MNLKEKLLQEKRTRWLDIGSGGNFEEGFLYADVFHPSIIDRAYREKYSSIDILHASEACLESLGQFDLVRMQHVLEHFSLEEGKRVIENCAKLLPSGGLLLVSVPDLKIHVHKYLSGAYSTWNNVKWWASKRVPEGAPDSFYFSIFAHSLPHEKHKWCYDFEGLKFQIEQTWQFKEINEISKESPLAHTPFTHNRPEEDLCVVATKF